MADAEAKPEAGATELAESDLSALVAGGAPSAGPSGTGKTLSAVLIGKLMPEEPIWYIGETEKRSDPPA